MFADALGFLPYVFLWKGHIVCETFPETYLSLLFFLYVARGTRRSSFDAQREWTYFMHIVSVNVRTFQPKLLSPADHFVAYTEFLDLLRRIRRRHDTRELR